MMSRAKFDVLGRRLASSWAKSPVLLSMAALKVLLLPEIFITFRTFKVDYSLLKQAGVVPVSEKVSRALVTIEIIIQKALLS